MSPDVEPPLHEIDPAVARSPLRTGRLWRALAILCLLLLVLAAAAGVSMYEQLRAQIGRLQGEIATQPRLGHVAVLLDALQAPAMLVTHDAGTDQLQLQRLNAVAEGREDSMQLWLLQDGAAPRSLGVLTSKYRTLQWPLPGQALLGGSRLAISVEDKGGVPEARGPRLPYLFEGALVRKAQ
jgi:anti-sigma-K factor RskA